MACIYHTYKRLHHVLISINCVDISDISSNFMIHNFCFYSIINHDNSSKCNFSIIILKLVQIYFSIKDKFSSKTVSV